MASRKLHKFAIARSVVPESMELIRQRITDIATADGSVASLLPKSHVSLFKDSMLSREGKRQYRAPSNYEMQTRVFDQRTPTWDPFFNAIFHATGAFALRGCIMLKLDSDETKGDHVGALHAAKVPKSFLAKDFTFKPHLLVLKYDETSVDAMDQMYQDERSLDVALQQEPLAIEFAPASVSIAQTKFDRVKIDHVFQPKRSIVSGR